VTGLALSAAPDPRDRGPDKLDVSRFPPEIQQLYPLFESKCSKCHSLARPINARLSGEQWRSYIKKMSRRPGSGINEETGKQLFTFLKFYSDYQEARAQAESAAAAASDGGTHRGEAP
jgi:hypothetical protein